MGANKAGIKVDKSLNLSNTCEGEKFLYIEKTNGNKNLSDLSVFFLGKCIDNVVGSEVKTVKKTRDGRILVQTKNNSQASKLFKLVQMSDEIKVKVTEDPKLNQSKGVIYSRDLRYSTDEEILEELKSQHVTEIYRVKRKIDGNSAIDTGVYFLTFNKSELPEEIKCGYERFSVRPYIPNPMQCYRCLKFGHTQRNCNRKEEEGRLCGTCGEKEEMGHGKPCEKQPRCINCNTNSHGSLNKTACIRYRIEKEIVALKVTKKITFGEARREYMKLHPLSSRTFARVTTEGTTKPPDKNQGKIGHGKFERGASSNSTLVDTRKSNESTDGGGEEEEKRKRAAMSPPSTTLKKGKT